MVTRIVGLLVLLACLTVSLLRGLGVMEGDFIIPLLLLSQLVILGYMVQLVQMFAKDILIRYTSNSTKTTTTNLHTWN